MFGMDAVSFPFSSGARGSRRKVVRQSTWRDRLLVGIRRFCLFVMLAGSLAVVGLFGYTFYVFLYHSDFLRVQDVRVRFNGSELTGDEMRIEYQLSQTRAWRRMARSTLPQVDEAALEVAIRAHPKVRAATVRKQYPGRVNVAITQRQPMALLLQENILVVDENGVVMQELTTRDPRAHAYPYVTGIRMDRYGPGDQLESESLTTALGLLLCWKDKASSLSEKTSELHFDAEGNLTVYLKGGTEIRFGNENPLRKMPILETFMKRMEALENYLYVDLRFDGLVNALPKSEAMPAERIQADSD